MRILLTGGAGYIGCHTLLTFLEANHDIAIIDNFSNSSALAVKRVEKLTSRSTELYEGDIVNIQDIDDVFSRFRPEIVIHFAGLKAVGESSELPLKYYQNNVSGTISLLLTMKKYGCKKIVFSSSATVYGEAKFLPYTETHPCNPTNAYGRTKYYIENILSDWIISAPECCAILLRYFNPVGAHESGEIGEDPADIPNNLMPFIAQVAVGRREKLSVFGNDYDTHDGTGVRDYIHVMDLAHAHLKASLFAQDETGIHIFNVGTGEGYSVLDMVQAFEKASSKKIEYRIVDRRPGDVAVSLADPSRASELLNWKSQLNLDDMCRSTWVWQQKNPQGYKPLS